MLRVHLDDEVADTYDVQLESLERPVEAVELELGLREPCLPIVEGDGAKPTEIPDFGVCFVALRQEIPHSELRSIHS